MTWILILMFVHHGPSGTEDVVTVQAIGGFVSQEQCDRAGWKASADTGGPYDSVRHSCLEVGGAPPPAVPITKGRKP